MDIKKEIESLKEELIDLRRDFHKYPELGFEEYRTSEKIAEYLKSLGIEVHTNVAKTGVVGLLRGDTDGKTLLMRADMDALSVTEENDVTYKSLNEGKMHACGHDGHMAMLLVAAKILSRNKDRICGNIKFVFQPNEEDAGAKYMVEEGVLENPHVDAAMAIHLWSPIETGKMSICEGPVMGAMDIFKIIIKGKGGHTAMPQYAIDPVIVAAQIITGSQVIATKQINPLTPTIVSFAKVDAGTSSNIIPEFVEMQGTLRYLYKGGSDSIEKPRERLEKIVKGICETFDTTYEIEFQSSNFTVENDKELTALVRKNGVRLVGEENLVPYQTMAGEDFSEFTTNIPSTFYFVGMGNKEKGTDYPHHHPKFDIDEDALEIGVEMHIRSALDYLSRN
ncbi:MAG: amidohydrolase [Tissierellia bacterium]|nr:amidohydrolase [Tissierellia bacterium]